MDVKKTLHMNGGAGEDSYAKNSSVQNDILSITRPYTKQALVELLSGETTAGGKLGIADLGCSSGPNALAAVSDILEVVYATWRGQGWQSPELAVFLNDLPGNDFNNVFGSLPGFLSELREEKGDKFGPCLVFGAPGSFHGRLFPSRSLHFVHSSSSLHWLSEVPPGLDPKSRPTLNKGKINISKTSSKQVVDSYTQQSKADLSCFLESRSKEVVPGGRMVLSLMGRSSVNPIDDEDSYLQWELIARCLMAMASEELVEEEKVDSFNMPYYPPCPEEIKQLVENEGSFDIDRLHPFEINWDGCRESETYPADKKDLESSDIFSRGEKIARVHRAVIEPIMECHFGKSIMDELFHRYSKMLDSYLSMREPKFVTLIVILVRKPYKN